MPTGLLGSSALASVELGPTIFLGPPPIGMFGVLEECDAVGFEDSSSSSSWISSTLISKRSVLWVLTLWLVLGLLLF